MDCQRSNTGAFDFRIMEEAKIIRRILNGDFLSVELLKDWLPLRTKMLMFASSTFTDTSRERNILLESILPDIRTEGNRHGIDVTFIDMRWGVRDENTIDHETWEECARELDRSFYESGGLYLLSLQGDKYGYVPLPKTIDMDSLDSRREAMNDDRRSFLDSWYRLDENSVPAKYVLRNLKRIDDKDYWGHALPVLRNELFGLEFDKKNYPGLKIGQSVTHWEAVTALRMLTSVKEESGLRFLWSHRHFDDEISVTMDPSQRMCDTQGDPDKILQIRDLKQLMKETLVESPRGHVIEYPNLRLENYQKEDASWNSYISQWERDMRAKLFESLNRMISVRRKWAEDGCGVGLPGSLLVELLRHSHWCHQKCSQFNGRTDLVKEMMRMLYLPHRMKIGPEAAKYTRRLWSSVKKNLAAISKPTTSTKQITNVTDASESKGSFDGVSFALIGSSGSGKTSLMAKLAQAAYEFENSEQNVDSEGVRLPARPVVLRFCGSSAGSVSGLSLVCGIIAHIKFLLNATEQKYSPRFQSKEQNEFDSEARGLELLMQVDYDTAVSELHKLLNENAIILLIDSVDQLSDDYLARSRISFLDGIRPHPRTRIVISALPDERDAATGHWLYCYQCHTRCEESNVPIVDVRAFDLSMENGSNTSDSSTEFRQILSALLAKMNRKLSDYQWKIVLEAARAEPSALYASLVARTVYHWKSFDMDVQLQPTVKGLLQHIFDQLERKFGSLLTRTALGLITFSVSGLTDNEIEDLLSLDDRVLNSVFQYAQLNVRRLPSHVWLRLRGAMSGLLVERTAGCLSWYHRQLHETVIKRYSQEEIHRFHSLMATYFSNIVPEKIRISRKIATQPLTFTSASVFFISTNAADSVSINMRRVNESIHHLVQCDMILEFVEQIRDMEIIFATIAWGNAFSLISNLSIVKKRIATLLAANVEVIQSSALMTEAIIDGHCACARAAVHLNEVKKSVDDYLRWFLLDMTSIISMPERALFATVTGNQPINSIARKDALDYLSRNNDKGKASTDSGFDGANWLRCSVISQRCLSTYGRKKHGALLSTFHGHTSAVHSIHWSKRRNILVSGGADRNILFWDVSTGNVLGKIEAHTDMIRTVAFSPDDLLTASSSKDASIRIWESVTGSQAAQFIGHKDNVWAISWSPDGRFLVSASADCTLRVWDCRVAQNLAKSGSFSCKGALAAPHQNWCIQVLAGHSKSITNVKWSPFGDYIVAVSVDCSATVWKVDFPSDEGKPVVSLAQALRDFPWGFMACCWGSSGYKFAIGGIDGIIRIFGMDSVSTDQNARSEWVLMDQFSNGNADHISTLVFSDNELVVLVGSQTGNIYIWDVVSKNLVFFDALFGIIYGASFSPHDPNVFAVCSQSGKIHLFNVNEINTDNYQTLMPFDNSVIFAEAPDVTEEIVVLKSVEKTCEMEINKNHMLRKLKTIDSSIIWIVYSSSANKLATANARGFVAVWDLKYGTKLFSLLINGKNTRMEWSRDESRLVCCSDNPDILLVDGANGKQLAKLVGHTARVSGCFWCRDDQLILSSSFDGTFKVWNVATCSVNYEYVHNGIIRCISCSHMPSSILIGFVDDKNPGLVQISKLEFLNTSKESAQLSSLDWLCSKVVDLKSLPLTCTKLAFNHAGTKIASAIMNETILVWDIINTEPLLTLKGHGHIIWGLCWGNEDSFIISGDRLGLLIMWDAVTGERLQMYRNADACICSTAFNPVDKYVTIGTLDGTMTVMNSDKFVQIASFYIGKVIVRTVDRSPCGRWLAGGYGDGYIRIFDCDTLDCVVEMKAYKIDITVVTFSGDGNYLLSAAYDGTLIVWKVTTSTEDTLVTITVHKVSMVCRSQAIRCVQWAPNQKYIAIGGHSKVLEIFAFPSLATLGVATLPSWVLSMSWKRCGSQIAVASLCKDAYICNLTAFLFGDVIEKSDESANISVRTLRGHTGNVFLVDWCSITNQILSCSIDQTIRIWDPATCQQLRVLYFNAACSRGAAWCKFGSGDIAVCTADQRIQVWNTTRGSCSIDLMDHTDSIFFVKFWKQSIATESGSKRQFILSSSADGTIRIWDSVSSEDPKLDTL